MAGDAGGARAVTPVIRELRARGHQLECRAYGPASTIWRQAGLEVHPPSVDLVGVQAVVLGTSVGAERHELQLIAAAARAHVRTVGVLDWWAHYRERFTAADGSLAVPDVIAVMDDVAHREAIAAGLPGERIVVTGHPGLDDLTQTAKELGRLRTETRAAIGLGDELVVMFVSQPLLDLYSAEQLGFDPETVLHDVVRELASVLVARRRTGTLLVKLHPREYDRRPTVPAERDHRLVIRVIADDGIDPRHLVAASDLVIGMNSILLLEACVVGVPTISYQPGIRIADPLPTSRLGWTAAVTDPARLNGTIDAELFDPLARLRRRAAVADASLVRDAARRVADLALADLGE